MKQTTTALLRVTRAIGTLLRGRRIAQKRSLPAGPGHPNGDNALTFSLDMDLVKVATVTDLPLRTLIHMKASDEDLILIRFPEGVFAFEDRCPHAGARLHTGELRGTTVVCPGHHLQFNLMSGELDWSWRQPAFAGRYQYRLKRRELVVKGNDVCIVRNASDSNGGSE